MTSPAQQEQQQPSGRFRLSAVGPAILLTATSVGAGDILTGSLAGAEAGMAVLWAVPAGVALKWTLTEGIARWQMATGSTLLEGWVTRLGRWIQWVFLPYLLLFSLVTGGMLASACGVAGAALLPLGDLQTSRFTWATIHSLTGLGLVWFGGYALLKRVLAVFVGAMFVTVLLTAFLLAPDWAAAGRGLIPSLPAHGAGWVIALIGAIGGTMALISYGYWIRDEGRTGTEGLRACRADLWLSYAVIGLFGIAVVIIGSRVQVRGQGTALPVLLAEQLGRSLGPAGRWMFLIGFWAAVFSALLGVWQSLPYLFTDFVALRRGAGVATWAAGTVERSRPYRTWLACMATIPLVLVRWPVEQLQLAFGLTGAMLLPLLALTLLVMNNREEWVGREFRSGLLLNVVLASALVFFTFVGGREIVQLLGLSAKSP
ncbi:MAG TPA: Nramp family divalent metal transporter [Bryobacteraceae bacterium]|nr:Nramp family divalent metal transporter [Bryobacteraceae bacterium]